MVDGFAGADKGAIGDAPRGRDLAETKTTPVWMHNGMILALLHQPIGCASRRLASATRCGSSRVVLASCRASYRTERLDAVIALRSPAIAPTA